jgi:hypothetical protein
MVNWSVGRRRENMKDKQDAGRQKTSPILILSLNFKENIVF